MSLLVEFETETAGVVHVNPNHIVYLTQIVHGTKGVQTVLHLHSGAGLAQLVVPGPIEDALKKLD